jgi:hypothetical protein
MTDIPIIFSGPMVRKLIEGRKTMTRRLATRLRIVTNPKNGHFIRKETVPMLWQRVKPGDRLWVRENIKLVSQGPDKTIGLVYMADVDDAHEVFYFEPESHKIKATSITPCIHMPRYVSRLTLTVTSKKIERVQDITMEDMIAEGLSFRGRSKAEHIMAAALRVSNELAPKWEALWRKLHGDKSWEDNPVVVAIGFTVHYGNIDAIEEAA